MAQMRKTFIARCQQCGKEYASTNPRRLYCCERCRRDYQNESRREARAELREVEQATHWDYDPWEVNDLDNLENIFANALVDGWTGTPCGLTLCADEAIGGAMACLSCERNRGGAEWQARQQQALSLQASPCLPGNQDCQPGKKADARGKGEGSPRGKRKRGIYPPQGKEVARARRRAKKRLEARGKQEKNGD